MKSSAFGLAIALTLAAARADASISVTIGLPQSGGLSDTPLQVAAHVESTYEIQGAVAIVDTLQVPLTYASIAFCPGPPPACYDGWVGTVPLDELARGPLTVTVVATDVFGDSGQAQAVFTFDRKPVLTVAEPIAESVARPTIHLTLSCTDDDPAGCTSVTVVEYEGGATLATGSASIDTTVSLAAYDGKAVTLGFWAQDSAGQVVGGGRRIYVESSTSLTEVASVPKGILDVQPDRILYGDDGGLTIRTVSSGLDELIPTIPDRAPRYGFLSPRGAVFVAGDPGTHVYDWRDGALIDLGTPDSPTSLLAKWGFAEWNEDPNLFRYDLQTGEKTLIPPPVTRIVNLAGDITPSGDVIFADRVPSSTPTYGYDHHLFRWHAGTSTQLTNSLGLWDDSPITDGTNVVFWRRDPAGVIPTSLVLLDGTGEETLDPDQRDTACLHNQVVNGWIAFSRRAPDGTYQVWLRSPSASELQVSFFGSSSSVGALSSEGRLTFLNAGRHYLKVPGLATRCQATLKLTPSRQ